MHLSKLIDLALLEQEIAAKYIKVGVHPDLPLRILNYTAAAMFDKRWNDATELCRGLIIDADDNVVARPWRKFYNLGQVEAAPMGLDEPVEITDKADGSLGIAYTTPEGVAIATRGSFTSDQAIWATNWVRDNTLAFWPMRGLTPLFEIVYPENRIVLDYGKWEGLILLGAVDIETGHVHGPYEAAGMLQWNGQTTEVFPEHTMAEFMAGPNANRSNAEGVVVRSGHRMVKVKQADYIAAHAVVTGLSNRSVWENLSDGYGVPEQASFMPDEFYRWLTETAATLTEAKVAWENEVMKHYKLVLDHMPFGGGRADFARLALQSPYSAALFKLYDCKLIDEMAWLAVRPAVFERPFTQSQDNN
jgi:RNA ligase